MPRTFRELVWAYRGHEYAAWEKVAQVCAMIAEANRDHKRRSRPYTAQDFFKRPGSQPPRRGSPLTGGVLRSLKPLFQRKVDE